MNHFRLGGFFALTIASALAFTTAVPVRPAAAADDTIVFGAALAATGSTAREGELTQEGYEFWKDYVNAHGGLKVGGKTYKVDIKYADDESNPQTAARLVEKFVSQDKVNFILGPYGSANYGDRGGRGRALEGSDGRRRTAPPRRSSARATSTRSRCSRRAKRISKACSRWR